MVSVAPFLTTGNPPKYAIPKISRKRNLDELEGGSDDEFDDEEEMGALERLEKAQELEDQEKAEEAFDPSLQKVIKEGLLTSSKSKEATTVSPVEQIQKTQASNYFRVPNKRGSILITLRNASPYTLWDVTHLGTRLSSLLPSIASAAPSLPKGQSIPTVQDIERAFSFTGELSSNSYEGNDSSVDEDARNYRLWRSFEFYPGNWEGYSHRRTTGWIEGVSTSNNEDILRGAPGENSMETGNKGSQIRRPSKAGNGECRTWEFGLNLRGDEAVGGTGAKRNSKFTTTGGKKHAAKAAKRPGSKFEK